MSIWERVKNILLSPLINFIVLILLLLALGFVYWQYDYKYYSNWIKQEKSFTYYIKPGKSDYKLIVGDLLGTNYLGQQKAENLVRSGIDPAQSLIVIPTLTKKFDSKDKIDNEYFWEQAGNEQGVIVVDNFCSDNWENIQNKSIYQNSDYSPGQYCGSEIEVQEFVYLVNSLAIKQVDIYTNSKIYPELINNFISFLEMKKIKYSLVNLNEN